MDSETLRDWIMYELRISKKRVDDSKLNQLVKEAKETYEEQIKIHTPELEALTMMENLTMKKIINHS